MTNDQAAEAMIRLAEPIGAICDDEEAVKMIDEYKHRYKMPLFYAVGKMIPTLVGYLLKKRKQELYEIVSILSGKKKSDVGEMNFAETVKVNYFIFIVIKMIEVFKFFDKSLRNKRFNSSR